MRKFFWTLRGYRYMLKVAGWANWSYISSLYENFHKWSPQDALHEDWSYWGD